MEVTICDTSERKKRSIKNMVNFLLNQQKKNRGINYMKVSYATKNTK